MSGATQISGLVFNIMRFATHDGPGIRTTVFFKGCPLFCWWCHNPEGQNFQPDRLYFEERCRHCLDCAAICPQHAIREVGGLIQTSDACDVCGACTEVCMAEARQIAGRRYTASELLGIIEKDTIFYDDSGGGVTLSGGEPLSQPEFASAVLDGCRKRGIHTTLETCGCAQPRVFRDIAGRADLVLFDLKLVDTWKHKTYTGVSNEFILENLEERVRRRLPVKVRIPVVPGINDAPEDVHAFAGYLGRLRPPAIELLPYHRVGSDKYRRLGMDYRLTATEPPAPEALQQFRAALAHQNLQVTIGG
jgi:pyruvate formate lyase activating enzyme